MLMYIINNRRDFSCNFGKKTSLVSFSKTSNSNRSLDSCYFDVFEKLTRAFYFQIALEIVPLPIQISSVQIRIEQ